MLATRVRWMERTLGAAIVARRCRARIKRISKHLPTVELPNLKSAVRDRFSGYSFDLWHKVYAAANGQHSIDYLPEDIFYNVFDNRLNPRLRKEVYKDKNHYDRLNWSCLPPTIFRVINGRLFDPAYRMIDKRAALALAKTADLPEVVVKPTRDTSDGAGVQFLDQNGLADFVATIPRSYSDWIVQHPVIQHEDMADLHPNSVCTLRVVTLRLGAEVSSISSIIRIGAGKSRVANVSASNGIAVGIQQDGRLKDFGCNHKLQRVTRHPDRSFALDQVVIPSFGAVQKTCVELHQTIPELDLISWDMAVDHRGNPVVLEFNIRRQDINYNQVCNGPVLGPYIDAVLARHKWHVIPGIGAIDAMTDIAPVPITH
jgi:Sugar-transfer associated ATP-grasp